MNTNELNTFLEGDGKGLWSYINLPDEEGITSSKFCEDNDKIYKGGENIIYDGNNKVKYDKYENEVSGEVLDKIFKLLYIIDYKDIFEKLKNSDDIDFVLDNYPDVYYKFVQEEKYSRYHWNGTYLQKCPENLGNTHSIDCDGYGTNNSLHTLFGYSLNKKLIRDNEYWSPPQHDYFYEKEGRTILDKNITEKFLNCFKGKYVIDLGCGRNPEKMEELSFWNGAKKYIGVDIDDIYKEKGFIQGQNNIYRIKTDYYEFLDITNKSLESEKKIYVGNELNYLQDNTHLLSESLDKQLRVGDSILFSNKKNIDIPKPNILPFEQFVADPTFTYDGDYAASLINIISYNEYFEILKKKFIIFYSKLRYNGLYGPNVGN